MQFFVILALNKLKKGWSYGKFRKGRQFIIILGDHIFQRCASVWSTLNLNDRICSTQNFIGSWKSLHPQDELNFDDTCWKKSFSTTRKVVKSYSPNPIIAESVKPEIWLIAVFIFTAALSRFQGRICLSDYYVAYLRNGLRLCCKTFDIHRTLGYSPVTIRAVWNVSNCHI